MKQRSGWVALKCVGGAGEGPKQEVASEALGWHAKGAMKQVSSNEVASWYCLGGTWRLEAPSGKLKRHWEHIAASGRRLEIGLAELDDTGRKRCVDGRGRKLCMTRRLASRERQVGSVQVVG